MKLTLYNAISLDGFIAGEGDDMSWIKDETLWRAKSKEVGCVIIGQRTFEMGEPMDGVMHIVFSEIPGVNQKADNVIYVGGTPQEALDVAQQHGHESVLLSGGGMTNATFAKAGLIDEVLVGIHPIFLRKGVSILGDVSERLALELLDQQVAPEGFITAHYRVVK